MCCYGSSLLITYISNSGLCQECRNAYTQQSHQLCRNLTLFFRTSMTGHAKNVEMHMQYNFVDCIYSIDQPNKFDSFIGRNSRMRKWLMSSHWTFGTSFKNFILYATSSSSHCLSFPFANLDQFWILLCQPSSAMGTGTGKFGSACNNLWCKANCALVSCLIVLINYLSQSVDLSLRRGVNESSYSVRSVLKFDLTFHELSSSYSFNLASWARA